jgi:hypothetical protein
VDCGVTVDEVRGLLGVAAEPTRDEQIGWALAAACALWAHLTAREPEGEPPTDPQVTDQGRQWVLLATARHFKRFDAPFGIAGGFESGAVYVMSRDPDLLALLTGDRLAFGVA